MQPSIKIVVTGPYCIFPPRKMNTYLVKKAIDLTDTEIAIILHAWNVNEWMGLSAPTFREMFSESEFHLLLNDQTTILALARINFDFRIKVAGKTYEIPELVGLVSIDKGKGFGSTLLTNMIASLKSKNIEALGFCEQNLRPFYEKTGITLLYNQARFIKELNDQDWIAGTDDDILNLTLSNNMIQLLEGLNEKQPAFLVA